LSSNDLLSIVLLIELQNFISLIIFFLLNNKKNNNNELLKLEAGIKFFLINSLSSILLFLALSILYFSLGTLNLTYVKELLIFYWYNDLYNNSILFSFILILLSFFIKIGIMPFHQ
jgi:multicomponent Na+:H+ antiporter subunit D